LKIFSDRKYLPNGIAHIVMLYPFWGKDPEDSQAPDSGRFDQYAAAGQSLFEMTSLDEADIAVLPMPWEFAAENEEVMEQAILFVDHVRQAGKLVVIFFCSDSDEEVAIENSLVFRTSFYRSRRKANEFAMPAWSEDFVEKYLDGRFPVRLEHKKPVVGFCGFAPVKAPFKKKVKDIVRRGANLMGLRKESISHPGLVIRAKALEALSRSPLVETNFLIREHFLGGTLLPDRREDIDLKHKVRHEYVQNIVDSDYILCARGAGNFSYRLFETLCCGRIPVFVDTDCVLPYDFDVEWRRYCVWVGESELPRIAEKVAEFHAKLSSHDLRDLQHECRNLWEQWLSPTGFFMNFYRHFRRANLESRMTSANG
jgi:Exostosin family